MTREQFEAEQDDLRREIVDNVGWMKPRIISELLRVQGLSETMPPAAPSRRRDRNFPLVQILARSCSSGFW